MAIKWINLKDKNGLATFYENGIVLNTVAMAPLIHAYKAQIGIDENDNIIISPISKDRYLIGDLNDSSLFGVQVTKSYVRINSKELMKELSDNLHLTLSNEGTKFITNYDELEGYLIIHTSKGEEK